MSLRTKYWLPALLLAIGLIGFAPGTSEAAQQQVNVALPSFKVTLNGHAVDSQKREYPLLVYKDIVYVPMTWYDSRLLGLETDWSPEAGLDIRQNSVTASYHPHDSGQANPQRLTAGIVEGRVTVNGVAVENSQEPYPVLSFRNISYFPLTWRFAHDEFGWNYVWDQQEGLSVQSANPRLDDVPLPSYAGDNGVAVYDGYYYYAETAGLSNYIYRSPVHDPTQRFLVYEYNFSTSYGPNPWLNFFKKDQELWFKYHIGGGVHGYDVYVRIDPDGTAEEKHTGYLDFHRTPVGTFIISYAVPPFGGNIHLFSDEGEEIGLPQSGLFYGWDSSAGGNPGRGNPAVVDSSVYISAKSSFEATERHIHRIDLQTGESVIVSSSSVESFGVAGDRLYYVKSGDRRLYVSDLDCKEEHPVSEHENVKWYGQVGDHIFYTVEQEAGTHLLYRVEQEASEADALVSPTAFKTVQFLDEIIIAQPEEGGAYSFVLFDAVGQLKLAVAEPAALAFIGQDRLLFKSGQGESLKELLFP